MKNSYLSNLIINGIIIMLMSYLFNSFYVDGFVTAILLAFVLSILNTIVKPILSIISLPLTFMTLGLFKLVINGFILYLASIILGNHFNISSPLMCIICAIVMSFFTSIAGTDDE